MSIVLSSIILDASMTAGKPITSRRNFTLDFKTAPCKMACSITACRSGLNKDKFTEVDKINVIRCSASLMAGHTMTQFALYLKAEGCTSRRTLIISAMCGVES
eukprot:scaffold59858_cov47-Prasinocladus_malaysianus.AAC.3